MNIKVLFIIAIVLSSLQNSYSQQDTITLKEVVTSSSRKGIPVSASPTAIQIITSDQIKASAASSLDEILESAANVDVRSRGALGVQSDISIRGGSFEQTLILVNGIPMTDPQTGHHSMNLPVPINQIERIEIIPGGSSRVLGSKAFAGAINIITKAARNSGVTAQASGGDYGFFNVGGSANYSYKNFGVTASAQKSTSDGYISNTDFEMQNYFAQIDGKIKNIDLHLMGGLLTKDFGAQNFYTSTFPDQFEAIKSRFFSASLNWDHKSWQFRGAGYYRRHNDRFELYREGDGWYQRINGLFISETDTAPSWYTGHNYHQTNVLGANFNLSKTVGIHTFSIGGDIRNEYVQSNVLGENLDKPKTVIGEPSFAKYTKDAERNEAGLYIEDQISYKRWLISAGGLMSVTTKYGTRVYPGLNIGFRLNTNVRLYATVSQSVRYPTYTDLYYRIGGAVGSKELNPETSLNYEVGSRAFFKYGSASIAAFRRESKALIDWIRVAGENITKAANITEVNFSGLDASISLNDQFFSDVQIPFQEVKLLYSFVSADTASNNFESNYVLDLLKHKFTASISQKISDKIAINWLLNYQVRNGGYRKPGATIETAYPNFFTVDARLAHSTKRADVFLDVNNIFNRTFVDLGNIVQPGRWIKAGLVVRFVK
jgi:iron complex outermembrane receptor protein